MDPRAGRQPSLDEHLSFSPALDESLDHAGAWLIFRRLEPAASEDLTSVTRKMEGQTVIKLYQFPTAFGLPNISPFCMKLECFLRMAKLDYQIVDFTNLRQAPKGKGPYIEEGEVRMGDSSLIIDYLQAKHGIDLDARLTTQQRAISVAFQALIEEHLYWVVVYNRWVDERNWPTLRELFFGRLPPLLRQTLPLIARRMVRRQLHAQGMGRHTAEEIYRFGLRDIGAIAEYLADKPFMHGESPTLIDACTFATVANILEPPFEGPVRQEAKRHANLLRYSERMRDATFGRSGDGKAVPEQM
ncbi:MAG: glutathione S-transferase family protein [Gammaproteobacteria bacterium]